jgi:hypothetical protein
MSEHMHRCTVFGCPNVAAYEVLLYDFDPAEGAVSLVPDDSCPFICVEHAIANEREAEGERHPWDVIDYPHTNLDRHPGLAIYRQLEPAYVA